MTDDTGTTAVDPNECPICQRPVVDVVRHIERKHPAIAYPGKFRFWRKPVKEQQPPDALVALALLRHSRGAFVGALVCLTGLAPEVLEEGMRA